jgi:serine/threonine protein phosphatase PrpC
MPDNLDFIIMGCDGVWEQKSNEEMVDWIYEKLKGQGAGALGQGQAFGANLNAIVQELLQKECLSPHHQQTRKLSHLIIVCRGCWLR